MLGHGVWTDHGVPLYEQRPSLLSLDRNFGAPIGGLLMPVFTLVNSTCAYCCPFNWATASTHEYCPQPAFLDIMDVKMVECQVSLPINVDGFSRQVTHFRPRRQKENA